MWKPAKDTQIPRRRAVHQSRASAWAARRRDPCPIIDGHHGHHGHPSGETLSKKILAARWVWAARRRDPCPTIDGHHGHHGHPSVKTLKKKIWQLGGVGVLTSGHSLWIFFYNFSFRGGQGGHGGHGPTIERILPLTVAMACGATRISTPERWAARRRDPCPAIDGHHGHHGHPSVKTLKKKSGS